MPTYFMFIRNSAGFVPDNEGQELPDLSSAIARATEGIRSILAEEVRGGILNLRGSIEIRDEAGVSLAVIHYRDAVEVIRDEEGR